MTWFSAGNLCVPTNVVIAGHHLMMVGFIDPRLKPFPRGLAVLTSDLLLGMAGVRLSGRAISSCHFLFVVGHPRL